MQTVTIGPNKALSYYFWLRGWLPPHAAAYATIAAFSRGDERQARLWKLSLRRR